MDSIDSTTNIGEFKVLLSPTPIDWATASAQEIFNTTDLEGERMIAGSSLQFHIILALAKIYETVVKQEQDYLAEQKVNSDYQILPTITLAIKEIQFIVKDSPWEAVVNSDAWVAVAMQLIGSHLATIIHIERLQFADAHPEHEDAASYKARFSINI